MHTKPPIAIDTECDWDFDKNVFVPFIATATDSQLKSTLYTLCKKKDYIALKKLCNNTHTPKVFHQVLSDLMSLHQIGIKINGKLHDTMIQASLVDENQERKGLKPLAKRFLNDDCKDSTVLKRLLTKYKKDNANDKHTSRTSHVQWSTLPKNIIEPYAIKDTERTLKLHYVFSTPLKPFTKLYDFELSLVPVIFKMQLTGLRINRRFVKKMLTAITKKTNSLYDEMYNVIKQHSLKLLHIDDYYKIEKKWTDTKTSLLKIKKQVFNPKSTAQVQRILATLKVPIRTQTKTGLATDKATLFEHRTVIFVNRLLQYKFYQKQLTTYYEPLLNYYTSPTNDRAHFVFFQSGAKTGRFSAELIQTIPKVEAPGSNLLEELKNEPRVVRKAFIPADDYYFISIDYDQIELRLFAHFSNCEVLIKDILSGKDPHLMTAYNLFSKKIVDKNIYKYRKIAKNIVFGIIYGMGQSKLANTLGVSLFEAASILKQYYDMYPVEEYTKRLIGQIWRLGYLELNVQSQRLQVYRHYNIPQEMAYRAPNYQIQGTAGYVMKAAMKRVASLINSKYKDKVRLLLTLHDELLFEVHKSLDAKNISNVLVTEMSDIVTFKVPIVCTPKISYTSWGEVKEKYM